MAHHTKEDCIRLGIPLADIKHRMTRRASWKKYWREGTYGITIHLNEDADLPGLSLGQVVGDVNVRPRLEDFETHPKRGENENLTANTHIASDASRSQSSLTEMKAPHTNLSPLGRIVDRKIREIGTHLHEEDVTVTHHVVMPSHIHFIIEVSKPLPMVKRGNRMERYHLGRLVQSFKAGITACYRRLQAGESVESILANATAPSPLLSSEENMPSTPQPSIWAPNFNDKILMTEGRLTGWQTYLCYNPYYWRLQDVHPQLFEHRLHLKVAGADYSAYGCMFLLRKLDRVQVFCHRLARRGQLTDEEWQKATASWNTIRAFEKDAREKKLGRFDKDWYRTTYPNATTAIDYTRTEAFRKQKEEILAKCEQENAILVSPAVSNGEKAIVYEALKQGYPCIKLVKDVIPEKGHPVSKDRDYCARGQMLVLGPWEIKDTNNYASRFGDADSKYAKFHNLNDMAAELCKENLSMVIDRKTLEKCK